MFNDHGLKVLVSMVEALVFEHGVGKNRPNGNIERKVSFTTSPDEY
jgi:hypothetical protein